MKFRRTDTSQPNRDREYIVERLENGTDPCLERAHWLDRIGRRCVRGTQGCPRSHTCQWDGGFGIRVYALKTRPSRIPKVPSYAVTYFLRHFTPVDDEAQALWAEMSILASVIGGG